MMDDIKFKRGTMNNKLRKYQGASDEKKNH